MNVEIEDLEAVTDIINSTFRHMAINYEEKSNYVIFRYFMISKKILNSSQQSVFLIESSFIVFICLPVKNFKLVNLLSFQFSSIN